MKHKKILTIILIILITNTSLILTISADTTNNTNQNDKIDQEQNQYNYAEFIYNQTQIAQSFTPTLPKITRIKLYISKQGDITSDLTMIIKDKITGPTITEISIPSENIPNAQPEWIEFNFTDIITESELYYFLCKTDSGDLNNYYQIFCTTTNSYTNGIAYLTDNNGETWLQESNKDFTFKTYGSGPILNIEFIRGLPGGRMTIGIKNIGTANADNIKITTIFNGGIMLKKYFEIYPNISLEPDHELHTEISPLIGFGMTTMNLYIYSDTAKPVETDKEVFIFFFYIYVKPN